MGSLSTSGISYCVASYCRFGFPSVDVFVVLRVVQVGPLVDHPGPRMRDPAVLYVGNRVEQPRVQRFRLFHGRQLDVPVLVQDG